VLSGVTHAAAGIDPPAQFVGADAWIVVAALEDNAQ